MRRALLIAAALMLVPPLPAGARSAGPPAACKMLTAAAAELFTSVPVKRVLENRQGCVYTGGTPPADETISLHVVGPVPIDTARASYEAAYRAARRTADHVERLRRYGPRTAFGYESSERGRTGATAVFLSGRWTVETVISAPDSTGDASIHDVAILLRGTVWPRWNGQR